MPVQDMVSAITSQALHSLAKDITKPSSNLQLLEAVLGLRPWTEPPDSLCCALGGDFLYSSQPTLLSRAKEQGQESSGAGSGISLGWQLH